MSRDVVAYCTNDTQANLINVSFSRSITSYAICTQSPLATKVSNH